MYPAFSSYYELIEACEAAIVRIRTAIRAGQQTSEAVSDDVLFILSSVRPGLTRASVSLARQLGQDAADMLQAMEDQLIDDILGMTYLSMETHLGAYIRTLPARILRKMRRNSGGSGASFTVEHLDETVGEDGMLRHETISDPRASMAFDAIGGDEDRVREAIDHLPADERLVIRLRLQDVDNAAIAQQLGVSPPTATRIYQRAVANLKRLINPMEE